MFGPDKLMVDNLKNYPKILFRNVWNWTQIPVKKIFSISTPIISLWDIILKWTWIKQARKQ